MLCVRRAQPQVGICMIEWWFAFLPMIRLSQPVIGVGLGVVLCLAACSSESDSVNSADSETAIEFELPATDAASGGQAHALPGPEDFGSVVSVSLSDSAEVDAGGQNIQSDGGTPTDSAAPPLDCLDVPGGDAEFDDCGVCDADDTNDNESCAQDCADVWGGRSTTDDCGVCDADDGNNNDTCERDCADVWDGNAVRDGCGVCDDNPDNDNTTCDEDCGGVPNGSAYVDDCGVCDADDTNDNSRCERD